ncbi:MAG: coproporphyrinogen III oxidase [Gracilibacter sp. BRH_c7a]|nr:MAG: coproporphyrinogen III oxidase [Gracilibacter sp. BRH_c7a]
MPSLYVHVPFCVRKCSYCAFYSLPLGGEGSERGNIFKYLTGLEREIEYCYTEAPAGVSSLFLGGGTPTVLNYQELDSLLKLIHNRFSFRSSVESLSIEKTVEANPGTIDQEKLAVLRHYGMNRISLGAQSFNDDQLQSIGRIHTSADIELGVKLIREAGFINLNLDLIFGLPGQTMEDWKTTVNRAVSLTPEHISIYALTLEEETPLGRRYCENSPSKHDNASLPDDDLQADMYGWASSFLNSQGYIHYEISNFAQAGFEGRHNLSYWQGEDYLGLGPGAVSCLNGIRVKNVQDIDLYRNNLVSGAKSLNNGEVEYLSQNQRISEYVMLGLRTTKGIKINLFEEKFKMNIQDIYGYKLVNYIDRDILSLEDGWLKINPAYLFVSNLILQDLIL